MTKQSKFSKKREKLKDRYLKLIEDAYNLRQTDNELSDISEYRAIRLLNRLNKLSYLEHDASYLA